MATLESEKTVIRRVLAPSLPIKPETLVWKTVPDGDKMVLYRGQCANPTKSIPSIGTNPYTIRTDLGIVLSTSKRLTQKIEGFARCPPLEKDTPERRSGGRLFEIILFPGTRYADLRESLTEEVNSDDHFRFLIEEFETNPNPAKQLPTAKQLRGMFFSTLNKEQEVLLDLRTIQFVREDGKTPETWTEKPEFATLTEDKKYPVNRPVNVYRTYVIPKTGGRRGRTFRTKTLRRNKHGRRLTRKSKYHVRNRHA